MKKLDNRGVTFIELAVLLVIVIILSCLLYATHAGIAEHQRNTTRERDIDQISSQLESYYSQYDKYPTLAQVNDTSWRAGNMKDLSKNVLRDPSSSSYDLVANPAKHVFAYTVSAASGKTCNNIKVICSQYTLTATLEGKSTGTYVKDNLN